MAADKLITQLRYTDQEVDQIKALFPDADALKLYRKYLLDLPLKEDEVMRIKATFGLPSAREILWKTTVPIPNGNEPIGVGYDILNNIDINEHDEEYLNRRIDLFLFAAQYLIGRLNGLDDLSNITGAAKWLSAAIGEKDFDKTALLRQLVIKQNVEGLLIGINAVINIPVETSEERAARIQADSTA